LLIGSGLLGVGLSAPGPLHAAINCEREVTANIVAFDKPIMSTASARPT
jgi:hypothetical protein